MIYLYDSLSSEKVRLNKKPGETVSMYVCGPTVYDNGHLGHGRSAVAFDIVRRTLLFAGYDVNFVFNYTDIDDKMIKRANREGITVNALSNQISPTYDEDYAALGIMPPTHNPRATEFIGEMIDIIKDLEEKGHAYVLEDGVYYDITTFQDYGKLSHQKLDELNAGARIEERKDKRNHQDFVLWKFKKEGEPFWQSPWGDGRPGWHIECSAMSRSLLGETFDIHGGGLDLKFPHHECEIAQSEAANDATFARYWMHNGYITVNDEKMSKSLGNFFTLRDIFKEYHPRVVRFFLIGSHYRSPIEFNKDLLEQARQTLRGLDTRFLTLEALSQNPHSELNSWNLIDELLIKKVKEKMFNDFDTAGALAEVFSWFNQPGVQLKGVGGTFKELNKLFNVFVPHEFAKEAKETYGSLLEERHEARVNKDWKRADELRDYLSENNIEVEDGPSGHQLLKPRI